MQIDWAIQKEYLPLKNISTFLKENLLLFVEKYLKHLISTSS